MIINAGKRIASTLLATVFFSLTAHAHVNEDHVNVEPPNTKQQSFPQRIIALSPHAVELLYSIGAGDRIIATIAHADYPQAAKNIEVIGDYRGVSLEKLIALQPDVVITWSSGNKLNQIEQIKSLGFKVVDSDPKSLSEISTSLRELGELTGQTVQAERIASEFEKKLAALTKQYQGRRKIRTFYQLWSKPLMTISNQSWINQFIERCGGINVFGNAESAYPKISVENILLTDAQVILIPDDAQTRGHDLFEWQRWQVLPAVINKHIYYPNAKILHRPTPRVLAPMRQVCEQIDKAR